MIDDHRKMALLLGHETVADWAADSDFTERDGEWFYTRPEDHGDDPIFREPQDIYGAIEGAFEGVSTDDDLTGIPNNIGLAFQFWQAADQENN